MEKELDMERALDLARLGASNEEIIAILEVNKRALTQAVLQQINKLRSERSVRLKAKLYELALKGNANAILRLMREDTSATPKVTKKKK